MSSITFQLLERSDFVMLQGWLSTPHIDEWWHEALPLERMERKFGPRIDGTDPTQVYLIEVQGQPVGWIQWYRWSDYPEHASQLGAEPSSAGLDLAIGNPEFLGKGIGPSAIIKFLFEIAFARPEIRAVVSDPEKRNVRSIRAFEKAGFVQTKTVCLRGEGAMRAVMYLDRERFFGTSTGP